MSRRCGSSFVVQVVGVPDRERHLAFHPAQVGDPLWLGRLLVERARRDPTSVRGAAATRTTRRRRSSAARRSRWHRCAGATSRSPGSVTATAGEGDRRDRQVQQEIEALHPHVDGARTGRRGSRAGRRSPGPSCRGRSARRENFACSKRRVRRVTGSAARTEPEQDPAQVLDGRLARPARQPVPAERLLHPSVGGDHGPSCVRLRLEVVDRVGDRRGDVLRRGELGQLAA